MPPVASSCYGFLFLGAEARNCSRLSRKQKKRRTVVAVWWEKMQKLSQWILWNTGWMYENSGFPRSDKITQNHEWWKIRMMEDVMNLRVFVGLGLLLRSFHQEEELPHPGEEAWLRNSLANAVGHMHMDGESWTVIRRSKIHVRFYKWLIQIRWRCQWVFFNV